jgi:hypothetical protein
MSIAIARAVARRVAIQEAREIQLPTIPGSPNAPFSGLQEFQIYTGGGGKSAGAGAGDYINRSRKPTVRQNTDPFNILDYIHEVPRLKPGKKPRTEDIVEPTPEGSPSSYYEPSALDDTGFSPSGIEAEAAINLRGGRRQTGRGRKSQRQDLLHYGALEWHSWREKKGLSPYRDPCYVVTNRTHEAGGGSRSGNKMAQKAMIAAYYWCQRHR